MPTTESDVLTRGARFPTPRPTGRELPCDDGEPMDTRWHGDAMTLLIDVTRARWPARPDFFVGGNMFVYFGDREVFHKDFRGPDYFVVSGGVDRFKERRSWVAWEESDRLPDVIVELASSSTIDVDRVAKKAVYSNRMHCREYFIYDPEDDRLEGWCLGPGYEYLPIDPDDDGRLWSEVLDAAFGTWDGRYADQNTRWLRLFEADGTLAGTMYEREAEARQAADAARQAADAEIVRLRAELAALRGTTQTTH